MNIQMQYLLLSFVITVILGFIIVPILKKAKVNQVIRADGPESHLSKSGTPTMGGIVILLTILKRQDFICYLEKVEVVKLHL